LAPQPLGQFQFGEVSLGQFQFGEVSLGQFQFGEVSLGQFQFGEVSLGQFMVTWLGQFQNVVQVNVKESSSRLRSVPDVAPK
jgi:hypothetical protein